MVGFHIELSRQDFKNIYLFIRDCYDKNKFPFKFRKMI
jgi:hypothetical protein